MKQIMHYTAGTGELEHWLVQESAFDARTLGKCEAIFTQGNGYLGLRNALEERYVGEARGMFVTGTFNRIDENEVTELPNLPDITTLDIRVGGHRLNLETGGVEDYSRTLNLKNGETTRRFTWTGPDGSRLGFVFRRFVSLAEEHLIGARVEITPLSGAVELEIVSGIRGEITNSGAQHLHEGERRLHDKTVLEMVSKTMESGVTAAIHSAHRLNLPLIPVPQMDRRSVFARFRLTLEKGNTLELEKLSAVHTSRDKGFDDALPDGGGRLKAAGMACIRGALARGYAALLADSAACWQQYWADSDIRVEGGDSYHQLGIRFALYHLNIMVKKDDNRVGIGAKAMSGEVYKGHSFWDTEMFILPFYTLCHPATARSLLEYRYKNLFGARRKARENGYEGAMYPWESAWVDDGEVTPLFSGADIVTGKILPIGTGLHEQHITADIVYALWQYFAVTGDRDYMERCGYEITLDTARFWASRLEYNPALDRYEINDVIGPDEYKEHVNNNAYTNYMAHWNMAKALELLSSLKAEQPELYAQLDQKLDLGNIRERVEAVIGKLYLPQPNSGGIVPQNDAYLGLAELDLTGYKSSGKTFGISEDYSPEQLNQYMVSKQADTVMLLFALEGLFDVETVGKNFLFYEARTLHDSSLSRSTHCVMACRLGDLEMAQSLFRGALDTDLGPWMGSSDAGIHSAAMGGIWQCAVLGFGGVQISGEGELTIAPRLPQGWTRLEFPLVWSGNPLRIAVQRDTVRVENRGKSAVELLLCGKRIAVEPGASAQNSL